MKFLHFTDPHIIEPGKELYQLRPDQRLTALIDHILIHHSDAECAVVTGDLTHWGDRLSFEFLRDTVLQLPFPCHLLIGNHDLRPVFQEIFPSIAQDDNGLVQYTVDTPAGVFVICDTVLEGTHAGWYDDARQEWLRSVLKQADPRPTCLFMHHPPFEVGLADMDTLKIRQSDAFAEIVKDAPHVKHLFFGHLHRPIHGVWKGIPFTTLFGGNHQVALDFNPSALTQFTHEVPSYNVVFLQEEQTTIHTVDYLYTGEIITDEDGEPASAAPDTVNP